jgi:pantoate--beta-alanine ligase
LGFVYYIDYQCFTFIKQILTSPDKIVLFVMASVKNWEYLYPVFQRPFLNRNPMIIFKKIAEITDYTVENKKNAFSAGFVPTMGALHEGHLSLVKRSKKENSVTIASIFVNPVQFNDKDDLARYPRTPEKDFELLEKGGCDVVFYPSENEMYPPGEKSLPGFNFGKLEEVMEGASRKGHFKGVATIVYKLLLAVPADRAYFGEKDFQQLAIIREMVRETGFPVEIIGCPTVREPDGLAMSSRNLLLSQEERKEAPLIYRILSEAAEKKNSFSPVEIKKWIVQRINQSPVLKTEYVEIADEATLQPVIGWEPEIPSRIFIAVKAGKIRLIDNIPVT